MVKRVLIVGCGFVGEKLADFLHAQKSATPLQITAWTATESSAQALRSLKPYKEIAACDISDFNTLEQECIRKHYHPSTFDVIVHCASSSAFSATAPHQKRAHFYRKVYLDGTRNLLTLFQPKRYIFAGSTSVYGQIDGSWVDEESPTTPERESGQILLETEKFLLAQNPTHIVARLAGIYGPGRSVLLKKFLEGRAQIEGDGSHWINQVHRDDIVRALALFVLNHEIPGGIYNVVDDTPLGQFDFYQQLAEKCSRPLPPQGAPIDFQNRKRAWTHKRVSNRKLRTLTHWEPQFPSFIDALPGLLLD